MPTSLKKRLANRANARRSTGPRSAAGRRLTSQNARVHGLSVPLSPQAIAPQLHQIAAQLVAGDGLPATLAQALAAQIVDYERNVQHEREAFATDFLGTDITPHNPDELAEAVRLKRMQEFEAVAKYTDIRAMDKEARKEFKWMLHAVKFINRIHARYKKRTSASAVRYYRRSTNQLIKALRGLA